jgi:hypothetical protein
MKKNDEIFLKKIKKKYLDEIDSILEIPKVNINDYEK